MGTRRPGSPIGAVRGRPRRRARPVASGVSRGVRATGDTLLALNLAAFGRIRISGDPALTGALASRWVLELLAAHPDTTIGVSTDVWPGPHTTRIRPVAAGQVPDVDVLVLGTQLSYADRAQIVSAARAPILLDLGADAAVSANWVITCGPDRAGALTNTARAASTPLAATLIIPPPTPSSCARTWCCARRPVPVRHRAGSPPTGPTRTRTTARTSPIGVMIGGQP